MEPSSLGLSRMYWTVVFRGSRRISDICPVMGAAGAPFVGRAVWRARAGAAGRVGEQVGPTMGTPEVGWLVVTRAPVGSPVGLLTDASISKWR